MLFRSSPAVCKSYLSGKSTTLKSFDDYTYYEKNATSLRMGDIGYQNNKEEDMGVHIDYNSIEKYSKSLDDAIKSPCKEYKKIGVYKDGYYKQINENILQIENEYYSTVRPKPDPNLKMRPSKALLESGVDYIELRSIDNNIFCNTGIEKNQMYFIELLIMHSLFSSEENISKEEYKEIKNNLTTVAHNGRDKNFTLAKHGKNIPLKSELSKILKELESIAIMMKGMKNDDVYMQSIEDQKQKIEKNEKLPSNLVLDKMIKNGYSFYEFCMENIWKQQKYFSNLRANNHILKLLIRESELSNNKKKELEKKENEKYEDYVKNYFLDI